MSDSCSPLPLQDALPGFGHIKRYWDSGHACTAAKILPGEYYVTRERELITTVLGSCISACIRDRELGVGGMNHFMLPELERDACGLDSGQLLLSRATRYGNVAMEHMINGILKLGGRKVRLEAKIFGGGRILPNLSDVGARNIRFVRDYLDTEGIPVVSEDVGEVHPRKLVYFPHSGRALVKRLGPIPRANLVQRETAYSREIGQQPDQGDIELF